MGYIKLAKYRFFSYDKIPSTQDMAHELITSSRATDCTAIIALAQSAGRGRYRRKWVSHHGNLYASFIYACDVRDARLSYSVAVAVADAIISFGVSPQIKWPNDILIDGKKVAGILIEYAGDFVVVGIGVNIKTNPTVPEYETTKLGNYTDVSIQEFLNVLIKKLDMWRNYDFRRVRERWLELVVGLNKNVIYRGKSAELIGINENGALILRHDTRYSLVYGDEITMS